MASYRANFLKQGNDDEVYKDGTKTHFPPWWRFWNRKLKTETSAYNDWMREFDPEGHLIRVSKKRSVLSSSGFGSRYYWESLDLKTNRITATPREGYQITIFPDDKCQEVRDQNDGSQEVVWGLVNQEGNNVPHVRMVYKNGRRISCKWVKDNHSSQIWKDVLKEHPISLEEKAKKLEAAGTAYHEGKKAPTDEAELREFKQGEEQARLRAHKTESRRILAAVRIRRRSGRL